MPTKKQAPRGQLVDHAEGYHAYFVSLDDGNHWRAAYRGLPVYFGFINSDQGVALLGLSQRSTTMVLTRDAGNRGIAANF